MTVFHFTGIKGSGMSSLAQILHDAGNQVQGSDIEKHFFTEDPLRKRGIKILPFNADNIEKGMTVIAGNAYKDNHEELIRANELGIDVIRYHKFLGNLMGPVHLGRYYRITWQNFYNGFDVTCIKWLCTDFIFNWRWNGSW